MKNKDSSCRDPLSWAGSHPGDGRKAQQAPVSPEAQDVYRLHEMRHKLDDDSYVDGALTRIANFLTSKLKKKGEDEQ